MKYIIALLTIATLYSCQQEEPTDLGLKSEATLKKCTTERECFSSFEGTVDAIKYEFPREEAKKAILKLLKDQGSVSIVKDEANYVYAVYDSGFSGLHDMEFLFGEKSVQIKSSSRAKYLTFKKGYKLIQELSFKFYQRAY